jgi:hypothetical protein
MWPSGLLSLRSRITQADRGPAQSQEASFEEGSGLSQPETSQAPAYCNNFDADFVRIADEELELLQANSEEEARWSQYSEPQNWQAEDLDSEWASLLQVDPQLEASFEYYLSKTESPLLGKLLAIQFRISRPTTRSIHLKDSLETSFQSQGSDEDLRNVLNTLPGTFEQERSYLSALMSNSGPPEPGF